MPADPNIEELRKLAKAYWDAKAEAERKRKPLDAYIQELKRRGYSYPVLERETGFARGTVQLIVGKESANQYGK